ncbi:signal transduction histidine kinase [Allocatelliglobosispora scoriae]|uniref:histidine kinase n=1 Tax=Allocatelliglobosispora scoriae TaxID=643052 RepID=A0A841BXV7_9ACTN|nr:histidine kinase [Allocatelliglobosispora scoriae]MBB5872994.1 signal transduction histidine kinase [Allocatelliglobosispora scoriae]
MADDAARTAWRPGAPVRAAALQELLTRAGARISARLGTVPARTLDVALAAGMLAGMVADQLGMAAELGPMLPVAIVYAAVIAGSLALRRRAPVTAYAIGTAALAGEALWVMSDGLAPYANIIGLYSVGLYATRGRALWGPVLVLPGVLAYFARLDSSPTLPVGVLFAWLLAWAAGFSGARRRERQEAARSLLRFTAVAEERARIARELHDLIGHTVNVMLVQAGAGRVVLDSDPGKARELLLSVEQTGRDALDELDRVLGALRQDTGPDQQPGLAELARLAQRMAAAGMAVTVLVEPSVGELPRSVDLSAYRIVQEALTNALRHGRAARATVSVSRNGPDLRLEVADAGRGPLPGYRPGRGLLGIAERAALFAGTVEHGRGDGGGFRVRAALKVS